MKRIAPLAATVIGVLAIPTAAMASTGSSGDSGSGYGYGTTLPLQPKECYVQYHRVHHHSQKYFDWWKDDREYMTVYCPFPREIPLPPPDQCGEETVTFSVAADSSAMTEVSGPQLSEGEQFVYDGNTYVVISINPGADQFTAFVNNGLFTNGSTAITNATGVIICAST
jgi:hypothetical protein